VIRSLSNRMMPALCRLLVLPLAALAAVAAPPAAPGTFAYSEPLLKPPAFDLEALEMLEAERRQHAATLAAFALAQFAPHANAEGKITGAAPESITFARKLVGLALHLDPRCRPAIVANGRLKNGNIGANPPAPPMSASAFSSFLVGRAAELMKAAGEDNQRLAGQFLDLAVALDTDNDDAVYSLEIFKLDGHAVDWRAILGGE
jgi:hypothetical protein